MKEGDKVYCIKDNLSYNGTYDYHYKNNWYIINYITEYFIHVKTNLNVPGSTFGYDKITFKRFFLTEKEYRKLKLLKINESRR